jgi:hypothetical protein
MFVFLYMFFANQWFIYHDLLLCRPSQRSARSQVPSQVATYQMIGSQLWAGEMLDSNPGWDCRTTVRGATTEPPCLPKLSHHASQTEPPCLPIKCISLLFLHMVYF